MKALKIGVTELEDGTIANDLRFVDVEGEPHWKAMAEAVGGEYIEVIHAAKLKPPFCMIGDEESKLTGRPLNLLASMLYGTDTHGEYIAGDVLIMKDRFTPEGLDTVGLNEFDMEEILEHILSLV